MRSFMPLMSARLVKSFDEKTARMPVMPQPNPIVPVSCGSTSNSGTAELAARKRRRERDMARFLKSWGLLDEDEREGRIEREQHQQDAGDAKQRQRHDEHLSRLGAGDGSRHEEAKTDRGRQQS